MAVGRIYLSSVVFVVTVRFLLLISQSSIANNSNEVSLHLWRYCKTCYAEKPCFVDGKPLSRSHRDFTCPNGLHVGSLLLLCGDIATQPGPGCRINSNANTLYCSAIKCFYMNARSVSTSVVSYRHYRLGKILYCVESWLKPDVLNCELLPNAEYTIHRRDRVDKVGGVFF